MFGLVGLEECRIESTEKSPSPRRDSNLDTHATPVFFTVCSLSYDLRGHTEGCVDVCLITIRYPLRLLRHIIHQTKLL